MGYVSYMIYVNALGKRTMEDTGNHNNDNAYRPPMLSPLVLPFI
jgi:hypothetical protein